MDDDEESNASSATTDNILSAVNGGTTNGRSVSNTVHDRSRLTSTSAPPVNGGSSTTVGRHHQSQSTRNSASSSHRHHHNSSRRSDGDRISSASSSTSTAKESFLNYFFGQNGPGPVAGANITNMSSEVHGHLNRGGGTIGRDVSGPDPNAFMRMRNGSVGDGSDAAFDMKSLGKHIEATSLDGGSHLSPKEEMETNLIRSLITSYFGIVRQTVQDLIPKAIMHLLVNHTSRHVQDRLVSTLYNPELFSELLHEDESLVSERARVKAMLDAYKDAFKILSEVNLKSG